MADKIVSWGGFESKGTEGFGVTGSFQVSSSGNSFFVGGGNVGIGTTSPTSRLHISSSNNNDGLTIHYPATNSTQFPFYIGTSGTDPYVRINASNFEFFRQGNPSTIRTAGSNNDLVLEGSRNIIFNSNGANERVRVTSAGDVGIGTTIPSARLHVSGAGSTGLRVDGLSSVGLTVQAGNLAGGSGTIELFAGNNNNSYLRLSSEFIREGSSGGLGINVARENITSKFQVRGSGATSSTTALRVENSNATASLLVRDDGRVFIGDPNLTTNWQITPGNLIHVTSGGSVANFTLTAGAISFPNSLVHFGGTAAATGGTPTLTTTRTNTASTSLSAVQFNFNITNSTGSSLVHNGLNIVNIINNTDTYSGTVRGIFYNPTLTSVSGTTHRAIETTSGDILFQSGSTPLLFVSGSGNVGIGTSTPTTRLDVVGGRLTLTSTGGEAIKVNDGIVNFDASTVRADTYRASTTTNNFIFRMGTNGLNVHNSSDVPNQFRILNNGNVGILTSTPFSDIPTVGTGSIDLGGPNSNITVAGFAVLGKTSNNGYGAVGSNYYLDNSNALRRRSSDFVSTITFNVGGFDFQSAGGGAVGSIASLTTLASLNNSGNFTIGNGSTTLGARIGIKGSGATSSTTTLRVENSNASASLVVLDNGNVGAGTIAPAARLDVSSGSAIFRNDLNNSQFVQIAGIHSDGRQAMFDSSGNRILSWRPNSIAALGPSTGYITAGGLSGMIGWRISDTLPYIGGMYVGIDSQTGGTHKSLKIITGETGGTSGHVDLETISMVGNVNTGIRPHLRISADKFIVGSNTNTNGIPSVPTMTITGSNVGIGTPSPVFNLDVSGSGRFTNGLTVTGSFNVSGSSTFNGTVRIDNQATATPTEQGTSAGVVSNYWGIEDGKFLSTPAAWLTINLDGTNYYLPAYQ